MELVTFTDDIPKGKVMSREFTILQRKRQLRINT